MRKLPIRTWAIDDRPREKMLHKGKDTLSDAELIAILINSGNREESAVDVAKRILKSVNNNLNKLSKLSLQQLTKFKGIGEAKAISIITALELGKRRHHEKKSKLDIVNSSMDVYHIMIPVFEGLIHEEFWVLYLNNANAIIAKTLLSKGGLTATLVDVRLLCRKALENSSIGVILCHNHPSGKLSPSISDIELTKKVKKALATLDIKLLDHVILTEKTYFSFADEGVL